MAHWSERYGEKRWKEFLAKAGANLEQPCHTYSALKSLVNGFLNNNFFSRVTWALRVRSRRPAYAFKELQLALQPTDA